MTYCWGMRKRALTAALVAAVALLAAGCGSSESSDATATSEWAEGLCSSISTWTSSLTSIVDGLKGGSLSKDSLSGAVDEAKSSTNEFTSSLDALGTPDTEAGQQAKDAVDELSGEIKADIQTIQDAVENASGVAGVLSAVQVIQETISKAGTQVSDTLTSFQDIDAKGELEQAFKDAPSCQKLTGGS
jgi:methyl-accepting chemotaxis protein